MTSPVKLSNDPRGRGWKAIERATGDALGEVFKVTPFGLTSWVATRPDGSKLAGPLDAGRWPTRRIAALMLLAEHLAIEIPERPTRRWLDEQCDELEKL